MEGLWDGAMRTRGGDEAAAISVGDGARHSVGSIDDLAALSREGADQRRNPPHGLAGVPSLESMRRAPRRREGGQRAPRMSASSRFPETDRARRRSMCALCARPRARCELRRGGADQTPLARLHANLRVDQGVDSRACSALSPPRRVACSRPPSPRPRRPPPWLCPPPSPPPSASRATRR